ncbi:DUF3784 domain-containing protein [Mammaliicoccus stepanovicii]|uniref:Domain of uncharacterized function (DUF3784) n=1 Tax=Mammaliicoccus stepanovicii TaxID=643214 RepID=A0A240AEK3_9STAP|nr:DUF3784 domain-containing protein [Mammaliicoccus stepanovicii]PNZ77753.1 DUF3784 domain-containing protein [Mammaliicoccus stepanovicii]GGI42839.1 hypothetical protein GCM10010896_20410 [Mammaliicoccus stepanovicii]SNV81775.1 Domain of uncharacterised function (DUF3784) [Mammaliicoccus stepanovicii]
MEEIGILLLGILFILIGICLKNHKLMFLIAGYNQVSLTNSQSKLLGKAVGTFVILTGALEILDYIRMNYFESIDSKIFYIIMGFLFILGLLRMHIQTNRIFKEEKTLK